MKPHQTAKAAVAKMAVMAIEISNEIAASLIQSVTSSPFPVGSIAKGCNGSIARAFQFSRDFLRGAMAFRAARCHFFS
jgi:hypothetical protein